MPAPPPGLVETDAPSVAELSERIRFPPETVTLAGSVPTLFWGAPPNQLVDHFEVSRLLPLNSSSKASCQDPATPVGCGVAPLPVETVETVETVEPVEPVDPMVSVVPTVPAAPVVPVGGAAAPDPPTRFGFGDPCDDDLAVPFDPAEMPAAAEMIFWTFTAKSGVPLAAVARMRRVRLEIETSARTVLGRPETIEVSRGAKPSILSVTELFSTLRGFGEMSTR